MLQSLTRYIFWQTAVPFAIVTFVLTGIIWLTQALRMLDVLISQGQSIFSYFDLTVLALPSTLAIVLPISLLCAVLYALHKLISDSEVVVMFSAGMSMWRVAVPVLAVAGAVSVVVLALNIYVAPAGLRELKSRLYEIRGDVVTTMLREGTFTNPTEGLTVYVRERSSDGTVHGILVQDSRNKMKPTTYLAETGSLVKSPAGPRLVMFNGNIQRVERTDDGESGPVTLLYFDKYTYDLSSYIQQEPDYYNEARERYFSELVNPAPDDAYAQQFRTQLLADANDRISNAIYPLLFALVALAALLPAPFSRRGYGMRIALAAGIALFFRVLAFGIVSSAATAPATIPVMYIVPLLVCAMAAAVLSGVPVEGKTIAGLNAVRAMIRHPRPGSHSR